MTRLITKAVLTTLSFACLFLSFSAQADFRKALDAYIARDGETMLKEVKHAVDTKNDDGLMLFLMATNMDTVNSDYDETTKQPKSTLRAILPASKWDEMYRLLLIATKNDTTDSQYYLLTSSQFKKPYSERIEITQAYINKNSRLAKLNAESLVGRAEAGDPESQLKLALKYLNAKTNLGCGKWSNRDCLPKDEEKGQFWLKHAIKSFETDAMSDPDVLASGMCRLFLTSAQENQEKLRQAYLWALKGIREKALISDSFVCLRDIYESGYLKNVDQDLHQNWIAKSEKKDRFNKLIYQADLIQEPSLLSEVRSALDKDVLPLFTYYFNEDQLALYIYEDGRVYTSMGQTNGLTKSLLMTIEPKEIQKFLRALKKVGFYEWNMADTELWLCDKGCRTSEMQVLSKTEKGVHRFFLKEVYLSDFNDADITKYKMKPSEVASRKTVINNYKKKKVNIYFAQMKTLIEQYFPTVDIRCQLGGSKKKVQECLARDNFWFVIAKKEK